MREDRPIEEGAKSRTQRKREHHALRELGVELSKLAAGQLGAIPLAEKTRQAVEQARDLRKTALQRQYRHIAKLLTDEDEQAIRDAVAGQLQPHADQIAALQETERWRDRLLQGGDSELNAFVEKYPEADRTDLRKLIRNAVREDESGKPPRAARLIFRYVRGLVDRNP